MRSPDGVLGDDIASLDQKLLAVAATTADCCPSEAGDKSPSEANRSAITPITEENGAEAGRIHKGLGLVPEHSLCCLHDGSGLLPIVGPNGCPCFRPMGEERGKRRQTLHHREERKAD